MFKIEIKFLLDRTDDRLWSNFGSLLREFRAVIDYNLKFLRINDHPTISCFLYLDEERLQDPVDRELLSLLSYIRGYTESTGTRVLQIIIGDYNPPSDLLPQRNGLWMMPERGSQIGDISRSLIELGAREFNEWLFLPFDAEMTSDDSDYELWAPDEKLEAFGRRINGSLKRISVPIGLKIKMQEGRRLSEYVSATFSASLETFPNLGGENVMLTTLLQMNNRLDMVNHYSERLPVAEALNLYSLSAMNLSLVDADDETNIAVLASSDKLIVKDIKMGE